MKYALILGFAFFSGSALSLSQSFDGCYQLLDTGVMYPAICISGTEEEGINGAGARLAIFETNTSKLSACFISSAVAINENEFVFEIEGRRELVLSHFSNENGVLTGKATVGNTNMQFVKLKESAEILLKSAAEARCI